MAEENYVTIADIAKHYKVSVSTIRAWMRSGLIPQSAYLKAGRTFRFMLNDVDAALRARNAEKQKQALDTMSQANNTDQDI